MNLNSVWSEAANKPSFESLRGNTDTNVLIIGGGMAGVLCAHFLKQSGVEYMLVEGDTIGSLTTKNTTAVLTAQHDLLYANLIRQYGERFAKMYLNANLLALNTFKELSYSIDCDFEEKPSVVFSTTDKKAIEDECKALKSIGFEANFLKSIPLPYSIKGAVEFPSQAQFHPLKFLYGIAKNLNIFEKTYVEKIEDSTAYTKNGQISFKKVIVTTHFPFINSYGLYPLKLYQKRSFVIAIDEPFDISGTYVDNANGGLYFRNYKNLLIIGGGDHRTGCKKDGFEPCFKFATKNFPKAKVKYAWATQDCMSLDGVPYIGKYSKALPNVYVASGFNEWGMTSSMISAYMLCDMVMGIKRELESIFAPNRCILKPQLFLNACESIINFVLPTTKRCSHLGCGLKWNKREHSYDCSCHGSRFGEDGSVINNPAMKNINVK